MTIRKYPLEIVDKQVIFIQERVVVLDIQIQDGIPCMWCLVDPDAKPIKRNIYCYGTGRDIDEDIYSHLGTIQIPPFVWHFFWMPLK